MKITHMTTLGFILFAAIGSLSSVTHAAPQLSKTSSEQKQWVGKPAPHFKLQDQNARWHELKHYQGKWVVLYFYPKDDSPGCTQEANQFKALYPQFTKNNAAVLGVSLDDVKSHQQFSKKLGLNFPILADTHHQLASQLGIVRNLGLTKMAKRETFLIDPQGTVVYHYVSVNTQTHAKQVLADIQKFSKK